MPNIIILNGSPVNKSSTGIVLEEIARGIIENSKYNFKIETVILNDLNYKFCQSCGISPEPEYCLYQDELYPLYKKIIECDIILFGSPIYFDSVSAQSKMFIDRCNCLRPPDFDSNGDNPFKKILPKKRLGAMVLVGGERGEFECARKVIAGWFKWLWVENLGMIRYISDDWKKPGTASKNLQILGQASDLGRSLNDRYSKAYADYIE